MNDTVIGIDILVKVSFGGPRNERYFDIHFQNQVEVQDHMIRTYRQLIAEKPYVELFYVVKATGELLAQVKRDVVIITTPIGAMPFFPNWTVDTMHFTKDPIN